MYLGEVHNNRNCGAKEQGWRYKMCQFSIAGWSQQCCRLEAAVLLAGASNRKEGLFVP